MVAKKKEPKSKIVQPEIHIESLTDISKLDYDYFPHMKNGVGGEQSRLINAMKDGTYQLNMQPVEYTAKINRKADRKLISGLPKGDSFSASKNDQWEYSAMVEKQTRALTKTRLEVLAEAFKTTNIPIRPRYYHNPLQYFDHIILADGYLNSLMFA